MLLLKDQNWTSEDHIFESILKDVVNVIKAFHRISTWVGNDRIKWGQKLYKYTEHGNTKQ